jgi:hypothetical protein
MKFRGRLSWRPFHFKPIVRCRLLAQSGHADRRLECPLLGVERTTFGGKLRLRLRRSDFLKISAPVWSEKTRRGKQRGKQFDEVARKP